MNDTDEGEQRRRYRAYLVAELAAAAVYKALAEVETDPERARVFEQLVDGEMRHASRWAAKVGVDAAELQPGGGRLKVFMLRIAARVLGTRRLVPLLVRGEAREIATYRSDPEARDLVAEERDHTRLLGRLAQADIGSTTLIGERIYWFGAGGGFRAAVLGMNDGLVSNFSLVMGVAGGTDDAEIVLLAGVAGLLAGAFSMAAGEYVSMRSQKDFFENQLLKEETELREWPEEQQEKLAAIYEAKGLSRGEAETVASRIMERHQVALETLARESLGLDPAQLGSPWAAAISSFSAFVAGAIVPILPYIFDAGDLAFTLSAVMSAGALLAVGGLLATLTGKNAAWGGLRMLLVGSAAAAVTFGVGYLIGVSVLG